MTPAPRLLGRRSLYILPTREGVYFGATLAVIFLAAVNYGNGLAYILTFLLSAIGVVAILQTHRNLSGVRVGAGGVEAVFAGQPATFHLVLGNETAIARYAVEVGVEQRSYRVDIAPRDAATVPIVVPTAKRGYVEAPAVKIRTRYPLGLWRAWSRSLPLASRCLVYPVPAAARPLPDVPDVDGSAERGRALEGDEFTGLREYRAGDSMQRVAWKKLAAGQGWHTKQFASAAGRFVWLDWDALPVRDTEERLSLLCRWVLDAEQQGIAYGLRLPTVTLAPGIGTVHRDRCLEALAVFPA